MERWEREALLNEMRAKASAAIRSGPEESLHQALRFIRNAADALTRVPATEESARVAMCLVHATLCLTGIDPNEIIEGSRDAG